MKKKANLMALRTQGALLADLEAYRRRLLLLALALALSGLGLLGWGFTGKGDWPAWLGVLLLTVAWALPSLYVKKVKDRLVSRLARRMGFRYRLEGLPWEEVAPSGLFQKPDRYESEDRVEGEVGGIPFLSTDLALWEKRRGSKGRTYYVLLFRGTLYRFSLPFPVEAPLRVVPQGMGVRVGHGSPASLLLFLAIWYGTLFLFVHLGMWGEGQAGPMRTYLVLFALAPLLPLGLWFLNRKGGLAPVRLEGPEFERFFDVYGEDQVAARKVLTPALMEALVGARRRLGRPFWAALEGENLWIALPGDRFQISPFRSLERGLARVGEKWQEELSEAVLLAKAFRLEEERARKGLWGKEGGEG